jgi:Ca-activated chloride channel family protein
MLRFVEGALAVGAIGALACLLRVAWRELGELERLRQSKGGSGRTVLKLLVWMAGAMVLAAVLPPPACAQVPPDEIHILPRTSAPRQPEHQRAFKSSVNLVLVNVTVTDSHDRLVPDLRANDFRLVDGKNPQHIRYFSSEDEPISVVVILDSSGSMGNKIEQVCSAAGEFFRSSNPQDEFAVVTLSDKPRLLTHFTDSLEDIESALHLIQPGGPTALWDAMYVGLREMRTARYGKKALLVISDGGDNYSRYTQREIKSVLREADAQVYAIDIFERFPKSPEEKSGLLALDEVTSTTGGRVFLTHDSNELHRAVRQINDELRTQYVLGYLPDKSLRDGKWHKIKVEMNATKPGKLRIYAKKGYYSPVD